MLLLFLCPYINANIDIQDINAVEVTGFEGSPYDDKLDGAKTKSQDGSITFSGELDRVYTPPKGPTHPVAVREAGKELLRIVRDNLGDVVVWNPWVDKSAGMGDFAPKDGWKNMVCVEAGSVKGWQRLEKGDAFEGAQTIYLA